MTKTVKIQIGKISILMQQSCYNFTATTDNVPKRKLNRLSKKYLFNYHCSSDKRIFAAFKYWLERFLYC